MGKKHLVVLLFTLIFFLGSLSFALAATRSARLFVPGIT